MLVDVLGLINPAAQQRASQIQRYAESGRALALKLPGMPGNTAWPRCSRSSAASRCPPETLAKVYGGQPLSEEEAKLYESHPEIAGKLFGQIPRLEDVAAMVAGQMRAPDKDLASGDLAS